MAQLIDERTQEVDEVEDNDAVLEEEVAATPESPEDDLPAQYKGKSTDEIIKMHQEAESRLGKQGEEVGQYRKIIDDFILKQTKSNEPEEAEEIDFFADPDKAVEHKIANHPTLKQLEQLGVQMQQSQTLSALQQKHPDLKEIATSPEFQNWVTGSKVRQQLYEQANSQYNYDAADELFSTWKEIRNVAKQTVEVERKERKQA